MTIYFPAGPRIVLMSPSKLTAHPETGLFNSIDNWDGLDVASGEKKPSFGQNDFEMEYIERIPCDESKTFRQLTWPTLGTKLQATAVRRSRIHRHST